jgi:hypothetical protein
MRQNIIDQLKQGVSPDLIAGDIFEGIGLLNTIGTTKVPMPEPAQDMFKETQLYYGDAGYTTLRTRVTPTQELVHTKFRGDKNKSVTSTTGHADTISVFIEFDGDTPVSITLNPNVGGKEYKVSKSIMGHDTLHIVSNNTGIITITECMVKAMHHQDLSTTLITLDV